MRDISANVGGVALETCVFNAAGPSDVTLEELEIIGKSASSAITMKSCTLEPRTGNPEPRYFDLFHGSLNSMGLPNLGYKEYVKFSAVLQKYNKPVVASVSGLSLADNIEIIKAFNSSEAQLIELNLSCPNIVGKPQVCYDFDQTIDVLDAITRICRKPLGVKLSPYFDFVHFEQMTDILRRQKVKFITCINSIGNALVIDPEKEQPVIKPKGGFGGLGGRYVKYTALGNVRKFYELLGGKTQIIGCGGVYTGTDAFEFILAGAAAVQVGTVFIQEGPSCFSRIQNELRTIMARKGYERIEDFRGQLKPLDDKIESRVPAEKKIISIE